MKPRTFAVGQRVNLRGFALGGLEVENCKGTIASLTAGVGNLVEVKLDPEDLKGREDPTPWIHPSQIKSRLIKKAKPEPRRVWISNAEAARLFYSERTTNDVIVSNYLLPELASDYIEFIEVLKPGGRSGQA